MAQQTLIDTSDMSPENAAALEGKAATRAERVDMTGPNGEKLNISRKASRLAEDRGYAIKGDKGSEDRARQALSVQGAKGYLGTAAVGGYSPPTAQIGDARVQEIAHVLATNPGFTRQLAEAIAAGGTVFPVSTDAAAAQRNADEDAARQKAGDAKREQREGDGGETPVSQSEPLTDAELDDEATTVAQLEQEAERLEVSKAGPKAELRDRIKAARAAG